MMDRNQHMGCYSPVIKRGWLGNPSWMDFKWENHLLDDWRVYLKIAIMGKWCFIRGIICFKPLFFFFFRYPICFLAIYWIIHTQLDGIWGVQLVLLMAFNGYNYCMGRFCFFTSRSCFFFALWWNRRPSFLGKVLNCHLSHLSRQCIEHSQWCVSEKILIIENDVNLCQSYHWFELEDTWSYRFPLVIFPPFRFHRFPNELLLLPSQEERSNQMPRKETQDPVAPGVLRNHMPIYPMVN